MNESRLIAIEGPENTGKTSLAEGLTSALLAIDIEAEYISFPGRESASIGALVYEVEHAPAKFGFTKIAPSARQALHLAAHLDAIENRIKPALENGRWVVLDRFWWSMWAHGAAQGLSVDLLNRLVAVEEAAWQPLLPRVIFTTMRDLPLTEPVSDEWESVRRSYLSLMLQEREKVKVVAIAPDASIAARVKYCLEILRRDGDVQ